VLGAWADGEEHPIARVALLREAATVHSESLADAASAIPLLRCALELAPRETALQAQLATTLAAAGRREEGIETVSVAIEASKDDVAKLSLLIVRAPLHSAGEAALADLRAAFGIDARRASAMLIGELERRWREGQLRQTLAGERSFMVLCAEALVAHGRRSEAATLLASWTGRSPADVEALRWKLELERDGDDLDAVVSTCHALLALERGERLTRTALALARALPAARPSGGSSRRARHGQDRGRDGWRGEPRDRRADGAARRGAASVALFVLAPSANACMSVRTLSRSLRERSRSRIFVASWSFSVWSVAACDLASASSRPRCPSSSERESMRSRILARPSSVSRTRPIAEVWISRLAAVSRSIS